MSLDHILGACLLLSLAVNVFQFIFWSRQVQKLVDKVMSRNYAEYDQISRPKRENKLQQPPEIGEDEVLSELNSMLTS